MGGGMGLDLGLRGGGGFRGGSRGGRGGSRGGRGGSRPTLNTTPRNTVPRTDPAQRTAAEQTQRDQKAREIREERARQRQGGRSTTSTSTPGKTGGKLSRLKGLAGRGMGLMGRVAAPLAVGAALYEGYTGYQEADQLVESGAINPETGELYTQQDETAGKTEAVTGAAGGFAGGLAGASSGAAMGAAFGSIVPGAGTVIGGAVGGLIGGFAGYFGGSALGSGIGDALTTTSGEEALDAAQDSGLYDKDLFGNSEINPEILAQTTDTAQLQAIISDNDLSNEDMKLVQDRLAEVQASSGATGQSTIEQSYSSDNPLQMGPGDVKEYNNRLEEINAIDGPAAMTRRRTAQQQLDAEYRAKFGDTPQNLEARGAYDNLMQQSSPSQANPQVVPTGQALNNTLSDQSQTSPTVINNVTNNNTTGGGGQQQINVAPDTVRNSESVLQRRNDLSFGY